MHAAPLPTVEHINIRLNLVVLGDGVTLPITVYFDEDGDECDGEHAVTAVAGTDDYGWLTIAVTPAGTVH